MIITMTRSDTATKGLIVVETDQTSATSLRLYKPTELSELSIIDIGDGTQKISMVIGQENYLTETNGVDALIINGVDQFGQTAVQISDTLSALFLDSSAGGGGGGTINPTDLILPYRVDAATFGDSSVKQTVPEVAGVFKVDVGHNETSASLYDDGENKVIHIGNSQPVVSPYDNQYLKFLLNLNIAYLQSKDTLWLQDPAISKALGVFNTALSKVSLGDVQDFGNGIKAILDDTAELIQLIAGTQSLSLSNTTSTLAGELVALNSAGNMDIVCNGDEMLLYMGTAGKKVVFRNSGGTARVKMEGLPTYANNAAAVTGGLAVGDLYKASSGDPRAICIRV